MSLRKQLQRNVGSMFGAAGVNWVRRREEQTKNTNAEKALVGEQARTGAIDAGNTAKLDALNTDTASRGALIDSQRGGLASTILNLGGAAGDPNDPFASQLVGTQAAGAKPPLESYGSGPAASAALWVTGATSRPGRPGQKRGAA